MTKKIIVQVTANFERNLESIEAFLVEAEAPRAYDALLDELLFTVIPNLEQFPDMGRLFMNRPVRSVEVINAVRALQAKLQNGALREYLLSDYLILYVRYDETIYLLSIKHHRQLSFDFDSHWPTN
jgi:plasmid stabilization system protein ParE